MDRKKKPLRLSEPMTRVLVGMANGRKLQSMTTIDGRAWLESETFKGLGETISHATVWGLHKRGLIRVEGERFPTRKYALTPLGKRAAKAAAQ